MKESLKYGFWWAVMPVLGCLALTLFFHEELRPFDAVFIVLIYPIMVWVGTHIHKAINPPDDESISSGESARSLKRNRATLIACLLGLILLGWLVFLVEGRNSRHASDAGFSSGATR